MKFSRYSLILGVVMVVGLAVGMLSRIPNSEAAFGASPPWVKNDHLLPGTSFTQIVNLSRNETDTAMKATVKLSGDKDLLKWLTIEDQDNLVMEKGQNILPMKVTVNVPSKAALKTYSGGIYVTMAPVSNVSKLQGGEVSITLGAYISMEVSVVGQKVTDFSVRSISVDPLTEDQPFTLKFEVENVGNTEINAIQGQVDIMNGNQTEKLQTLQFIPFADPIAVDSVSVRRMVFKDVNLKPGNYQLALKALKDGKVIFENTLFQEVTPKIIPVVKPEDALASKPALPGTTPQKTEEAPQQTTSQPVAQAPVAEVHAAAPVASETNSAFLIFGLAGLGMGLIALIGVIVVLVVVLRNQQKAVVSGFPMQTQMPVQNPPADTQQPATQTPVTAEPPKGINSDEKK